MKLETVSKIKGWVALSGILVTIIAAITPAPKHMSVHEILFWGSAPFVAVIYTVKWLRLRRFIRRTEYAGRVLANR